MSDLVRFSLSDMQCVSHVTGLEVACRCLPALDADSGGDCWCDVVSLPAGRTALVAGDVMGRGTAVASVMARLRSTVRTQAVTGLSPAEVLTRLNELVASMREQFIATCVYAVHEPDTSSLCLANAGNLPPVLAGPDGIVELIGSHPGAPLGAAAGRFGETTVPFSVGSRLLLYTDGLVEAPGRPLDVSLTELRAHLSALDTDLEVACDKLLDMRPEDGARDDVALLYVRARDDLLRRPPLVLPPVTGSLERVRELVRDALAECHLYDLIEPLTAIANELAANAVKHAGTPFEVLLRRSGDRVTVEVLDRSRRLPRLVPAGPSDACHRGLHIVAALARRWGVRPTLDGKVVWAECG